MKILLPVLSLLALGLVATAAAPANDDFASRIPIISTGSVNVSGSNVDATNEVCDPTTFGTGNKRTVWWTWTAPTSGQVFINTFGSSFDTVLGIYAGNVLCNLSTIASNDDNTGLQSKVGFVSVAGVPYQIMVGGFNGASGLIRLAIVVSGTCTYTISPTSKAFPYTATNGTVTVSATTGCAWSAVSNDSWLVVTSGNSGTGFGSVLYTVAANTALASRTGTITIAGTTFTVAQGAAPGCTYVLSPATADISASPLTNTATMTAGTGCAWTATPNAPWLTIQSGGSGTGNGTITYVVATNSTVNARSGTITAAGQTHTVNQAGTAPCLYAISPTSASYAAAGGSSTIAITTGTGCTWTASSPDSWVTFSSTNGTSSGTVSYTVAANAVTLPRSTTLTVAGQAFTISQAAAACSYGIVPSSLGVAATSSTNTVAVSTTAGCAWTAVANVSWLAITSGTSGSGNGTVTYVVAANPDTNPRSGTMTIAGNTFTVNQVGAPCIYAIAPSAAQFTATSQTGSIAVTAGSGCAWTAVSNDSFITVNSGTPGSGNGTVGYTVSANATTSSRTGTITVAGFTFTVTQDGTAPCTYSILPTSCACAATASTNTIAVTANSGCAWSVTSSDSWLTFSPSSGTGNGTVTYVITDNPSSIARMATLTIAGQVFTVNQAGVACTFTVVPAAAQYTAAGGSGSATVTAAAGCAWISTSDSTWLAITTGASGVGNGSVTYTVASTTATTNRVGRLTIAGKVLLVTQTGAPCSATISPTAATVAATGTTDTISLTESDASCTWTAVTNATWISVSPASGTGSALLNYIVLPTTQTATRTGTITVSSNVFTITQAGDTTAPTVTLVTPANGSSVTNVITLTATASDDVSVSRVDYYRGSAVFIGSATTSPYSFPFNTTNLANGSATFYARAFDPANNQGFSTTNTVTVANPAASTNEWSQRFGGAGHDYGLALAYSASDSTIVLGGAFSGSVNFGGGVLTNATGSGILLAKYNLAGVHQWSKVFSGPGSGQTIAVAVDSSGNIYATGWFVNTVNFGGSALTSAGSQDIWVAKYSTSGTHLWSKRFGSSDAVDPTAPNESGLSIRANSSSEVIVAGSFVGTVDFGCGALTAPGDVGFKDGFVAKLAGINGACVWSKQLGGSGQNDAATGVTVDSSNNVLVTGRFAGTLDFGCGSITNAGSYDVFLAKFTTGGVCTWTKSFGGTLVDTGNGVAVDSSGNVAITGYFNNTINFGGSNLTSAGGQDIFAAEFNSSGTHLWSRKFGGTTSFDNGTGVAIDSSGNVFLTGYFSGNVDFGGGAQSSAGAWDVFIAKYSSAGVFSWSRQGGGSNIDEGLAITVDTVGGAYNTGRFFLTSTFVPGIVLTNAGGADIFLNKFTP